MRRQLRPRGAASRASGAARAARAAAAAAAPDDDDDDDDDCRLHERCAACARDRAAAVLDGPSPAGRGIRKSGHIWVGPRARAANAANAASAANAAAVSSFLLQEAWQKPARQPVVKETPPGLEVVFEDEDIVVVNKPSGLLSTPGRGPDKADSVLTRARDTFGSAFLAHRLDQATSGILVLARTKEVEKELFACFRERQVSKSYLAKVRGTPPWARGTIELPLVSDWLYRPLQKVCFDHGKPSETRFEVLSTGATTSVVKLEPITGRSHQLRVHLAALGHPIVGDDLYSADFDAQAAPQLLLHASELRLGGRFANVLLTCAPPFDIEQCSETQDADDAAATT